MVNCKSEILSFFNNLFSTVEYVMDAFVNYDNTESPLNIVTKLIDWSSDFVSQFRDGREATPEELQIAQQSAELLKLFSKQIIDIAHSVSENATKTPRTEVSQLLYKSTRGRQPSHVMLDPDLVGSALSPFGLGVTQEALMLAKEKGVGKCIALLVASQIIQRTAEDIVKFIFLYRDQLDEEELGDYLGGDGGTAEEERKLMDQIRYHFVRGTNWKGMGFDEAIRHFLTKSGFR